MSLSTTALSTRERSAALQAFDPAPDDAAAILHDLGSPDITLRDVATRRGIGVPELTLWMSRPDVAAQLDAIESAVLRRARLIATNTLPFVANTLTTIIQAYIEEETHMPMRATDRAALAYRARVRDQARKAAGLLLRLARSAPHTSVSTETVPQVRPTPRRATCASETPVPQQAGASPDSGTDLAATTQTRARPATPKRRALKPLPQLTPRMPPAWPAPATTASAAGNVHRESIAQTPPAAKHHPRQTSPANPQPLANTS